jgi:hypothetical protein
VLDHRPAGKLKERLVGSHTAVLAAGKDNARHILKLQHLRYGVNKEVSVFSWLFRVPHASRTAGETGKAAPARMMRPFLKFKLYVDSIAAFIILSAHEWIASSFIASRCAAAPLRSFIVTHSRPRYHARYCHDARQPSPQTPRCPM